MSGDISVPDLGGMLSEHGTSLWPDFAGTWPTSGPKGPPFTPMGAWGIPAINTALLLSSGATITWAHWGLLRNNRTPLILGLAATVLLGTQCSSVSRPTSTTTPIPNSA